MTHRMFESGTHTAPVLHRFEGFFQECGANSDVGRKDVTKGLQSHGDGLEKKNPTEYTLGIDVQVDIHSPHDDLRSLKLFGLQILEDWLQSIGSAGVLCTIFAFTIRLCVELWRRKSTIWDTFCSSPFCLLSVPCWLLGNYAHLGEMLLVVGFCRAMLRAHVHHEVRKGLRAGEAAFMALFPGVLVVLVSTLVHQTMGATIVFRGWLLVALVFGFWARFWARWAHFRACFRACYLAPMEAFINFMYDAVQPLKAVASEKGQQLARRAAATFQKAIDFIERDGRHTVRGVLLGGYLVLISLIVLATAAAGRLILALELAFAGVCLPPPIWKECKRRRRRIPSCAHWIWKKRNQIIAFVVTVRSVGFICFELILAAPECHHQWWLMLVMLGLIYSPAPKGWSHCVASPNEAQGLL